MNIKTITGSSIQAALAEARRLLGDDVVLLESVPAQGRQQARITVMTDAPAPEAPPRKPPEEARRPLEAAVPAGIGYGYGAAERQPARPPRTEENAVSAARFSPRNGTAQRPHNGREWATTVQQICSDQRNGHDAATPPTASDGAVAEQMRLVRERLESIEQRMSEAVIGASQQWMAHPLYAEMLRRQLRPLSLNRLFDRLAQQGYAPTDDMQKLRWALAQELRRALDAPPSGKRAGVQVLIGPSGAGKTSLLLKLAGSTRFYGYHRASVLVIVPEGEDPTQHHATVDLYRRFALPVQAVQTIDEMRRALHRAQGFAPLLIDTPPLPTDALAAGRLLTQIKRLLEAVTPVQVTFTLNATRAFETFDVAYLQRLPLRPDALALTHLDETPGWGRAAEWLMALPLPVPFVATGPALPDDVAAFSPTWFVEKMMEL